MTFKEITKLIDEYPTPTKLDKSVQDLFRTIAQRAYEAGKVDGSNMIIEIQTKMLEETAF